MQLKIETIEKDLTVPARLAIDALYIVFIWVVAYVSQMSEKCVLYNVSFVCTMTSINLRFFVKYVLL